MANGYLASNPESSILLPLNMVEVERDRFEELVKKETRLEIVAEWVKNNTNGCNNYVSIADLKFILGVVTNE